MAYLEVFSKVLPVLLIILLGHFLRRIRFLRPETVGELKKLVVNLTLPAVLFLAFSKVDLEPKYLLIVGTVFLLCVLALLLGGFLRRPLGFDSRYFSSLMTGFEAGMMGYAIFSSVYGAENIYKFGLIDLGQVIFVFFVLVTVLERYDAGPRPFSQILKSFFRTPVILAIMAGILFKASGLIAVVASRPLSASLLEALALIAALTTPLVALVIGYEMRLKPGNLALPLRAVLLRFAFWVPTGLLVTELLVKRLLGLDAGFQAAVMTMFVLPSPFVIPLYMRCAERRDLDFVVNSLTLSTLVTLFAFSLVSMLYPL